MAHTTPLKKRSTEEIEDMLDKGLGYRAQLRARSILRKRQRNARL